MANKMFFKKTANVDLMIHFVLDCLSTIKISRHNLVWKQTAPIYSFALSFLSTDPVNAITRPSLEKNPQRLHAAVGCSSECRLNPFYTRCEIDLDSLWIRISDLTVPIPIFDREECPSAEIPLLLAVWIPLLCFRRSIGTIPPTSMILRSNRNSDLVQAGQKDELTM